MTGLSHKLLVQAEQRGDAPAIVWDAGEISWSDLADRVLRCATWLRERDVQPGDRVVLLFPNRPAYLVCWLALANIGAVAVSINTGLVGDGLNYSITQSNPKLILGDRALFAKKQDDLGRALEKGPELALVDDEAELERLTLACARDVPYAGDGAAPFSIIYTSGTTGLPKGVLNCQTAFLASGRWMVEYLSIDASDRIMLFLPLFHTNPQMYAVMSALEVGCALVLRDKFSVSSFFDDARRFDCTMFTYVGTVLAMLCNRVRTADHDHRLTRCVGGGCATEVWATVSDRFGITPYELYGMTEVGGWVTGNSAAAYRPGTCGTVRPDMEVRIFDAADREVPQGVRGEIVVRPREPDRLLLEYWDNAPATLEAMRNLWFHTGDVGSFDTEGYLSFHGRTKEIIRRGGENISPQEVEASLLKLNGVLDAAVVGVHDPVFGQEIKAVVVTDGTLEPRMLRDRLRGRLAAFMLPRYVQFVPSIPRTETQKIQRRLLEENETGIVDLKESTAHA